LSVCVSVSASVRVREKVYHNTVIGRALFLDFLSLTHRHRHRNRHRHITTLEDSPTSLLVVVSLQSVSTGRRVKKETQTQPWQVPGPKPQTLNATLAGAGPARFYGDILCCDRGRAASEKGSADDLFVRAQDRFSRRGSDRRAGLPSN
jgi:hypothetical protein